MNKKSSLALFAEELMEALYPEGKKSESQGYQPPKLVSKKLSAKIFKEVKDGAKCSK